MIPEFAVLGHPNEGKSSVVSTLTENDNIRVTPTPGETTHSTGYTVKIDGKEIIRFVDTPGFQVPQQTLAWFNSYEGDPGSNVSDFIKAFGDDPFYADECELLRPVAGGAGIIYVVDGSRPVRANDLAEIEILRLTGRPRMAVINSKSETKDYTHDWKLEFRKHFNSIRIFNSNTAGFPDRIAMLESLKAIDQEWEPVLSDVIRAFKDDWKKRNQMVCADIVKTFEQCLSFSLSEPVTSKSDLNGIKENLNRNYEAKIKEFEQKMFSRVRSMFKHRLYDYTLPEYSVLNYDLFSGQTWKFLGLNKTQLAGAGAVLGGTIGVVADAAAGGASLGLFALAGGIIGAGSALWGGRKAVKSKPAGLRLGGEHLQAGPSQNLQFLYILLDRALLYYSHIVSRSHGCRDLSGDGNTSGSEKKGYAGRLSMEEKKICAKFFKAASGQTLIREKETMAKFQRLVASVLDRIVQKDI